MCHHCMLTLLHFGWLCSQASLAAGVVDVCLIPEVPFDTEVGGAITYELDNENCLIHIIFTRAG